MTARLALGTMRTSGFFNGLLVLGRDEQEAETLVRTAIDGGITLIDTAPIYARGLAEKDVGVFVGPELEVWTKAGVDISTTLPQLDYTLDGMLRSLQGSLERLRRDSVGALLVHNPAPVTLEGLPLAELRERCAEDGTAERVGVSLLQPSDAAYLDDDALPSGSPLMCEAGALDELDDATADRLRERTLVVRSLFAGGGQLHGLDPADVPAAVEQRLREVQERWAPEAIVIGPRDTEQLAPYLSARGEVTAGAR